MKKVSTIIVASFMLLVISACSGNDVNENTNSDNNVQTEDIVTQSELTELEEGDLIIDEIEDLADLDIHVQSDDVNRRMILLKSGDVSVYRSVYVKRNNHLKIINLEDNHRLVFEGTID